VKFPIFFENSKVPVWLSKVPFVPIEIGAISLGIFVFSRGPLSEEVKNHETIHYRQWLELGFIGFLILYPAFWLYNLVKYRSGSVAYMMIPFECEAYGNEQDLEYLSARRPYSWIKFLTDKKEDN